MSFINAPCASCSKRNQTRLIYITSKHWICPPWGRWGNVMVGVKCLLGVSCNLGLKMRHSFKLNAVYAKIIYELNVARQMFTKKSASVYFRWYFISTSWRMRKAECIISAKHLLYESWAVSARPRTGAIFAPCKLNNWTLEELFMHSFVLLQILWHLKQNRRKWRRWKLNLVLRDVSLMLNRLLILTQSYTSYLTLLKQVFDR